MSSFPMNHYKAYTAATGTVAKTRQVVMLYDNILKLLRQTIVAVNENKIEDRFLLLKKSSETIIGLQSSIDFDNGGEIANILHNFYTGISMRMVGINFIKDNDEATRITNLLIDELKQMRDIWDNIDRNVTGAPQAESQPKSVSENFKGIVLSV